MPQQQCPWCGHLGERYRDGEEPIPVDSHRCVCRHVTAESRLSALYHGGRFWDESKEEWQCAGCCTMSPPPTEEELATVDQWREEYHYS